MSALHCVIFLASVIVLLGYTDGAPPTLINSPNYPKPYKPTNIWRENKQFSKGQRVKVTVTQMDLADGDIVAIYDGYNCDSTSRQMGLFTGSHPNINKVYFANSNTVCVSLRAPVGNGKGFSIKLEDLVDCHGTYYLEDGSDILSPGYPNHNYLTSKSCRWSITVDRGQRILYKVMDIQFEDSGYSYCPTYITLSDVHTYTSQLCKSNLKGKTIMSTTDESDVIFHARKKTFFGFIQYDDSGYAGFWLTYKAIGCKAKLLQNDSDNTGKLSNKNDYYPNLYTAKYKCKTGYWFDDKRSENLFICKENDKRWAGQTKQCIEIRCGHPSVPADGKVSLSTEDKMDSIATYTCNTHFTISPGDQQRKCLSNGSWSGTTPKCNGIHDECSVPGDPTNGRQIGTDHQIGDTIGFECHKGYQLGGEQNLTCLVTGNWSDARPSCKAINCRDLNQPANGALMLNSTTFGSYAIFRCLPGYKINGSMRTECLSNGMWSAEEPTCQLITCPALQDLYDGSMAVTGSTPGSQANFICYLGFNLNGPTSIKCRDDGTWSSPLPFCSLVHCPILRNATNTLFVSSAHRYLDVVVYQCNPDYYFDSDRSIAEMNVTCQADGTWSPNITGCLFGAEMITTPETTTTATFAPSTVKLTTAAETTTTETTTTKLTPETSTIEVKATGNTDVDPNSQHAKQGEDTHDTNIYIYIAVAVIVTALVVCIAMYVVYRRRRNIRERSPSKAKLELPEQDPSSFQNPLYSPHFHPSEGPKPTDRKSKAWLENPTYHDSDNVAGDDVGADDGLYDSPSNIQVEKIASVDD